MITSELQQHDQNLNWHPCSQMKDYETFKPLVIKRAYGSYFELADGRKVIDAISSWWCKSLGHNHPRLKQAALEQIEKFEHVIFAHTTHDIIVQLAQKLTALAPNLDKVFYAGDGSSAVEIALKMSLHTRHLRKQPHKVRFAALHHGYHGETLGALSVSDVGRFREPYTPLLFTPLFITPPYVDNINECLWSDAKDHWQSIETQLTMHQDTLTAIIVEPILQGAGGMRLYSADFLSRLASWAKAHDIHLIADEIMTGMGRTGKMFAYEHANITPDFLCLSKGLTSGWLPFSVVLTRNSIYDIFYDDRESSKAFLHSHTYSGNALGASIALATLNVIEQNNLCARACELQTILYNHMNDIAVQTGLLSHVRAIGAMVAADLPDDNSHDLSQQFIAMGAFIRPLGKTLYWLPPLNISLNTLVELKEITLQVLHATRMQR